jgi:GGDEF domain-containing protein
MKALARAIEAAGPRPQPPARWRNGPQTMEDLELRARFDGLSVAQRVHEFFYDANTGVGNEEAFEVLTAPPAPSEKPLVAHYSVDGVKWVNDTFGHDAGQMLLRVVAEALHKSDPDIAKVRGDFGGRVESARHAETIARLATARLPPEWRGFTITASAGSAWEDARANHVALKQAMEAGGTRAARGSAPAVPADWRPRVPERWVGQTPRPTLFASEEGVPGRVEQRNHPDLERAYARLGPERAFGAAYRDPTTGILGHVGMGVLHSGGKNVLAIDIDGLRATDRFQSGLGDAVVEHVARQMAQLQELFGESLAAAHPHGDEYGAAHRSPDRLRDFAEALKARLAKAEMTFTDPELGMTFVQRGIGLSFGIGPTRQVAEQGLARDKARRVEAGERDLAGQKLIAAGRLTARAATPEELAAAVDVGRERRGPAVVRVPLAPGGPMVTWHLAPARASTGVSHIDAGAELAVGRGQWVRHPTATAAELEGRCPALHRRGIRPETLRAFAGLWREDDAGRAVFAHETWTRDEVGTMRGGPVGAEVVADAGDAVSDRERVGLWDSGERQATLRIVVVERALDALSHYQMTENQALHEGTRYLAPGGIGFSVEQLDLVRDLAERHPEATIVAAFGRSPEGDRAAVQLRAAVPPRVALERDPPLRAGRWNDSLQVRERDYIRAQGFRRAEPGIERERTR